MIPRPYPNRDEVYYLRIRPKISAPDLHGPHRLDAVIVWAWTVVLGGCVVLLCLQRWL